MIPNVDACVISQVQAVVDKAQNTLGEAIGTIRETHKNLLPKLEADSNAFLESSKEFKKGAIKVQEHEAAINDYMCMTTLRTICKGLKDGVLSLMDKLPFLGKWWTKIQSFLTEFKRIVVFLMVCGTVAMFTVIHFLTAYDQILIENYFLAVVNFFAQAYHTPEKSIAVYFWHCLFGTPEDIEAQVKSITNRRDTELNTPYGEMTLLAYFTFNVLVGIFWTVAIQLTYLYFSWTNKGLSETLYQMYFMPSQMCAFCQGVQIVMPAILQKTRNFVEHRVSLSQEKTDKILSWAEYTLNYFFGGSVHFYLIVHTCYQLYVAIAEKPMQSLTIAVVLVAVVTSVGNFSVLTGTFFGSNAEPFKPMDVLTGGLGQFMKLYAYWQGTDEAAREVKLMEKVLLEDMDCDSVFEAAEKDVREGAAEFAAGMIRGDRHSS